MEAIQQQERKGALPNANVSNMDSLTKLQNMLISFLKKKEHANFS